MNTQTSSFDLLDKTTQKTNEVLRFIEEKYGWVDRRNQAYAALRAVLHVLRDRLPIELAAKLGAQFPTFIRGVYYEGWNPSKVPIKMDREEFLAAIRNQLVFSFEGSLEELVRTVITAIKKTIDPAELEKISNIFPEDLKNLLKETG